ncbi:hypothetical protein R3P38DRAFT_3070166 [Favolaschia claudopus]|uniref:F-box domain-containing protein n=1 Tax=Favolaschia claudopus TaxID=2862362 RepID=A0AAV9ZZL4_9AGAR
MQRTSRARTGPGPGPHDMDAISKQVTEDLEKENRKAIYYPAESARGREVRDRVLAIGDLLAVIFVHCLPVMPTNEYSYPSPRHAPMLVAHVCQYWRPVALSTPSLWSCFALENGFTNRLFRLWMKRSGAMPLSLSADKDSLSFVLPLSSRWKNITFHLNSGCLPFLASIKNKIPNLHRLFVKFSTREYSSWTYSALPSSLPTCDVF